MHLTKNEEQILNGEQGDAKQRAMKALVRLGDREKAENLILIRSAHIPNVSYTELSAKDFSQLSKWAEHFPTVKVLATLNAGGVSARTPDFVDDLPKQGSIINTFKAFGVQAALTTAPYTAGNEPQAGNDVAWGHASAVVYANSVLGACTNNHNWETALASALIGSTPNCGLHIQENRQPEITLDISEKMFGYEDFSALGFYASKTFPNKLVNFVFPAKPNRENLQALASGYSVNTKKSMFTIGAKLKEDAVEIGFSEVDSVFDEFSCDDEPDFVALGCPHFPSSEFQKVSRVLKGKKLHKNARFWVYVAEKLRQNLEVDGFEESLRKSGCVVATDACACLAPLKKFGVKCVLTNSAELCAHAKEEGVKVKLTSFDDIVKWGFK